MMGVVRLVFHGLIERTFRIYPGDMKVPGRRA